MRLYQIPKAGSIDDLTLTQAPTPTPGQGQALVRIRATSLNYRDLMIITNTYGRPTRPNLIPLSDGAGEVVAVGDGVTRIKVGDRVAGIFHQKWIGGELYPEAMGSALGGDIDGVLSEFKVFDAEGLVPIPEHLSFEEAATLPCAAVTAWDALFHSAKPVKPGSVVLTLGTGGVSVFAIQFAHAAGARVIATSSADSKLEQAKSLGATDGINYKRTPEWDEAVLQLTGGSGADHVVDVGGAGTLPRSLNAVCLGGIVHVIGLLSGAGGQINPLALIPKAASLNGVYVGSREMFEAMNRSISVNRLKPAIDRVFGFEEAKAAYEHLKSGSHFGKVVIRV